MKSQAEDYKTWSLLLVLRFGGKNSIRTSSATV